MNQTVAEALDAEPIFPNSSEILMDTSLSKLSGMMYSLVGWPSILAAMAYAALIFISSVILEILCSEMPLKIPGNTRELLIWF